MKVYFDDGDGRLRPGDDLGLQPADVTFTLDVARCCIIGRCSPKIGVTIGRRTSLEGQTRGQAELRIYEALRVALAGLNPIAEEEP